MNFHQKPAVPVIFSDGNASSHLFVKFRRESKLFRKTNPSSYSKKKQHLMVFGQEFVAAGNSLLTTRFLESLIALNCHHRFG